MSAMGDWIGLYGAALSTILAGVALWNWWLRETYLTVHGFHQFENWMGKDIFAFAITNSGRRATIVRQVKVSFFPSRDSKSRLGEAVFDQSSRWNPATKDVPVEGKPNTSRREPNVLQSGDELHGAASPIPEYDPEAHWIKISAFARNSKREFSTWIEPQKKEVE